MANHLLLSLSFAFLIGSCLAFQPFQQQQNECQIQRINALEPNERVEAEGGWTEFFDANDQQFRCAGVEVIRHHIKPQGLLLPSYINTPLMVYIKQGKGYQGIVLPGCPETFQSSQQLQERSQQSFQDRHQKIRTFRQGDLIVIPTGAAHWMYNDGQEDIVAIVLLDSTNSANQLDQFHRRFFLAGNPKEASQQQQQGRSWGRPSQKWQSPEESSADIFRGFDLQILSDAFNVDHETAQKLQSPGDNRGHIVTVQKGLQVIKPPVSRQEQERGNANGFEETICSAKLTSNIDDPSRADFYNPQAGRCTQLNSYKFPILQWVQLSAERGVLHANAIVSPYWVMNAHGIIYVTSGNMRMQVVNNQGQSVFNEQVREGQLVVVPQNFAVAKQAGQEGCKWISFRTNDNAMINTLAGHNSAIRAMPVDVIANSYQMSKEQASNLKFNRKETVMFNPRSQSWGWSAAA
ncbi:legumin A-like [Cynara cardunculus var. scolymus]|uniref:legumin A-like n=1 Tax=Cynara cardunculus var. scolymus TaxID=59895 RepID=UPI000D62AF59|nr:legumin A-like [Cynara cardunculus var. scolymus]